MATNIYKTDKIYLFDGTEIEVGPLKLKYLREFMEMFQYVKYARNDDESLILMIECAKVAMKQYYPQISHSAEIIEENIDIESLYKIFEFSAGIKIGRANDDRSISQQSEENNTTWEDLDLAKIEAEIFLIGAWKSYEEMELCLSMPEILATISSKRELDFEEKKFLAAIQGVDIESQTSSNDQKPRGQKEWEDLKARVFSRGQATDSNDVLALQGVNAQKAGFGIGMGLDYEDLRNG